MTSNWIGIPVYGCKDLTLQTISDCLAQDIPVNILIVDNGSPDDTLPALKELCLREPRIFLVENGKNLGVAAAWNQLAGLVFDCFNGDSVLICNNDIRLRPDTLRNLLIPKGGFITPVNVGTMEAMQAHDAERYPVPEEPIIRSGPDFSCFLLKKAFYQEVGFFHEGYWPAYFEDRDYHMMAIGKGLEREIYSVAFPYVHLASQTIKNNPEAKAINDVNFALNKALFIKRWGGEPHRETRTTPDLS